MKVNKIKNEQPKIVLKQEEENSLLENIESESGAWEVLFKKDDDLITIFYFTEDEDDAIFKLEVGKSELLDLKKLLNNIKISF